MVSMGDCTLSVAYMLVISVTFGTMVVVVVAFNHNGFLSAAVMMQWAPGPTR